MHLNSLFLHFHLPSTQFLHPQRINASVTLEMGGIRLQTGKKIWSSFIHPQWAGSWSTLVASRQWYHLRACKTDRLICSLNAAAVGGMFSMVFPLLVKRYRLASFTFCPSNVAQYKVTINSSKRSRSAPLISPCDCCHSFENWSYAGHLFPGFIEGLLTFTF